VRTACVIGNCQADGLADWLAALSPGLAVEAFSVAGVAPDDPQARARWRALLDRSDWVVMQTGPEHRARFGLPEPDALRAEGRRVTLAPWIIFRGFHPDCVYLFHDGAPIPGAAGPLQSAIALAARLEGLTRQRTLRLYNAYVYARMGYFDAHAAALDLMREEWTALGLDPSPWLAPRAEPFMHTINHPIPAVLEDVARQLLSGAGLQPSANPTPRPPDRLIGGGIWPVYPELAERLGLEGATAYRRPGLPDAPLEAAVAAAHDGLDAALADGFVFDATVSPLIAKARAFIRDEVI
jgi:hypothetical protein